MSLNAKIQYLQWLSKRDPFLFEVIKKAHELKTQMPVSGIFDSIANIDWAGIAKTASETVQNVAPALVQYKAQMAALKTNLKRAETGLPPIDYAQYTPTVKVSAEVTPEMEEAATRIAIKSVESASQKMTPLLIGGGVLALLFFFMRRKR